VLHWYLGVPVPDVSEVVVPADRSAVVGQGLPLPIVVRDLDQDALAFIAQGLPAGARIVTEPQYGHATIAWTPSAAQAGVFDISLAVTDQGGSTTAALTVPSQP
jgi:hypothetical protein